MKKIDTSLMDRMFDVEMKAEETDVKVNTANLLPIGSYVKSDYEYVTESHRVEDAIRDLLSHETIGFDCETVGLDSRTGKLRLVQLGHKDKSYVFDCFKINPKLLQPVFTNATRLAGVNLPFDLDYVWENGIEIGSNFYDCRAASQLKYAGTPEGMWRNNSMANMTAREAGVHVDKEYQNSNWSGVLSQEQLQYAAYDTYVPIELAEKFARDLNSVGLKDAARVEMRVLPSIVWMHRNGALIDEDAWSDLVVDAMQEQQQVLKEMNEEAGVNSGQFGTKLLNWSSIPQVRRIFASRGHHVDSTNEPAMIALAATTGDRLAKLMIKYRKLAKRISTYGYSFLDYRNPKTGRIHAEILQMGASESGRMSCINPNLQNIPRDHRYRACFIAPDGWLVLGADYSQIELRLAAQIARDAVLIELFREGKTDVHTLTAMKVIGCDPDTLTKEELKEKRFQAKAVNFGFIYGMGAAKFQIYAFNEYGISLSLERAEAFREAFFQLYRGIKRWHGLQGQRPIETRTILGRRSLNVERYSEKLNYPVQGSAGDGMKIALALMWEHRHESSALPYLVVHDEVLAYTPANNSDRDKFWMEKYMHEGMSQILTEVPVEAEACAALNWDLAKV